MNEARARRSFRRWVVAAGVFNLASSAPLALPLLYRQQYHLLNRVNDALGLGGRELAAPAEGVNMLFVNTAGLILCSVGVMLLYAARNLRERYGIALANAVTRVLWALLVIFYVLTEDLARVMLSFAATDLLFAAALIYHAAQGRRRFS